MPLVVLVLLVEPDVLVLDEVDELVELDVELDDVLLVTLPELELVELEPLDEPDELPELEPLDVAPELVPPEELDELEELDEEEELEELEEDEPPVLLVVVLVMPPLLLVVVLLIPPVEVELPPVEVELPPVEVELPPVDVELPPVEVELPPEPPLDVLVEPPEVVVDVTTTLPPEDPPPKNPPKKPPPKPPKPPDPPTTVTPPPLDPLTGGSAGSGCGRGTGIIAICGVQSSLHSSSITRRIRFTVRGFSATRLAGFSLMVLVPDLTALADL